MPATTKRARRRKTGTKTKPGAVMGTRTRTSRGKPITIRLAPDLQRGMDMLRIALKRPVNTMINEAVKGFIQRRTAEVDADLAGLLSQVKAHKRRDPKFDAAFAAWAKAEAKLGAEDPAEGVEELAVLRHTLDNRYDDLKNGRVKPIDGEEAFARLREKSEQRRSRLA